MRPRNETVLLESAKKLRGVSTYIPFICVGLGLGIGRSPVAVSSTVIGGGASLWDRCKPEAMLPMLPMLP